MKADSAQTPARYGMRREGGRVQCTLCPRHCLLRDGQVGFCGVRKNQRGHLILTGYGRVAAIAIDPIEKKPLYHFLPGSQILSLGGMGCNLDCSFCQNSSLSAGRDESMLHIEAAPEEVAGLALKHNCASVAFTYNEPVISLEYVVDTARVCRARGLRTVAVTAGYISSPAREEFFSVMDAANIDLKALDKGFYRKQCGAHLQPVLDTLRAVHAGPTWLEITNLLIPGENDGAEHISDLATWIARELSPDVPLHLSAFHPAHRMQDHPPTPAASVRKARKSAQKAGLKYVYTGNIQDREGGTTYCTHCGAELIQRNGYDTRLGGLKAGKCASCGTTCSGLF